MRIASLALAALLLLAGCGSVPDTTAIVPAEAVEKILAEVAFRDTLVEAEKNVAGEWYTLDESVTDFAIYISGSGATAEEIAVIKTGDIKTAEEAVRERVADLEFRFKDYIPAEMQKIQNPVIVAEGDVVVLILSDDSDAAQKAAEALFK